MGRKVLYEFDPFEIAGKSIPKKMTKDERDAIREDIADYATEQVLRDIAQGISSVSGKKWAGLSKAYKKFKQKRSAGGKADLEFEGDLLAALEARIEGRKIKIGWHGGDQGDKADGHNNHSGQSSLPQRRSIPAEGEEFRKGINQEIASLVAEALDEFEG